MEQRDKDGRLLPSHHRRAALCPAAVTTLDDQMIRLSDREVSRRRTASAHVRGVIPTDRRAELDFYRTPPVATWGLLSVEDISNRVWDPACGDGRVSGVLREAGYRVVETDLAHRGHGRGGVDFLKCRVPAGVGTIVTNPPFTHMVEFIKRATEIRPPKFCFIGRLLFMEGRKKRELFKSAGLSRV